jgi:MFS family permease
VAGAGVAAYLYQSSQMGLFFLCGLVGLAAAVVLLPLQETKKDNGENLLNLRQMLTFRNRRPIIILCSATLLLLTGNYIVYSVFPQYLTTAAFNLSVMQIGFIVAGSGLTGVLVFRAAGKLVDRVGRRKVLIPTFLTYVLSWTIYALTQNIYVLSIIWLLPYWCFFTTSSTAMVSDLTDERERGRGIGILNAAINFGNFAGSLLGGFLARGLGYQPAFAVAAVLVFSAFLVSFATKESNHAGKHDAGNHAPQPSGSTPPAPPTVEAAARVCVPAAQRSVPLAPAVNAPVLVPPLAPIDSTPAFPCTVPVLLKLKDPWLSLNTVVVPAPAVFLKVPELLKTDVPACP